MPGLYVHHDPRWNDSGWRTLFHVWLVDGEVRDLGTLKILSPERTTQLSSPCDELPLGWLSAPVDPRFYELARLAGVEEQLRTALHDVTTAQPVDMEQPGVRESLLRAPGIRNRLVPSEGPPRIAFDATLPGFASPHQFRIEFNSGRRVAALVGPNGAGKTQLLDRLAREQAGFRAVEVPYRFDRLIGIAYSAFDSLPTHKPWPAGCPYVYLGLRHGSIRPSGPDAAGGRRGPVGFVSIEKAMHRIAGAIRGAPDRGDVWPAVAAEAFPEGRIGVLDLPNPWDDFPAFRRTLERSGSGHRIAAMVVTGLACAIGERSLVLFDEPESHLHPGLVSGILRAIRVLLDRFESYMLVATHSPLPLQEIPGSMIRRITLEGDHPFVEPYPGESFGANLGEIVQDAFNVRGSAVNFRRVLKGWMAAGETDEAIRERLGGSLSPAAEIILRAMRRHLDVGD